MSKVAICNVLAFFDSGIDVEVLWDYEASPHMAIGGISGTGKTYALKMIAGKIAQKDAASTFWVCDFKGDIDFKYLSNCGNFGKNFNVKKIFNDFYETFEYIQNAGNDGCVRILIFDEWAAFLNCLDKKEADEYKKKLGVMLMLGRAFNFHIILSQQRLDAEFFGKYRDNFSVVMIMGNPSKEVIGMFFSDYKDRIIPDSRRGTGFIIIENAVFYPIIVPTTKKMFLFEECLRLKTRPMHEC